MVRVRSGKWENGLMAEAFDGTDVESLQGDGMWASIDSVLPPCQEKSLRYHGKMVRRNRPSSKNYKVGR
jgi:hypothetical protein